MVEASGQLAQVNNALSILSMQGYDLTAYALAIVERSLGFLGAPSQRYLVGCRIWVRDGINACARCHYISTIAIAAS